MGHIYLITNLVNNKIYIGKTANSIVNRWKEHVYDSNSNNFSNSLLHKAIKKYGESNFKIEELESCDDTLLNEKERYYIELYNSFFLKGKGYNLTYGGEGAVKYSDKEILSLWNQGFRNCEIANILKANESTISLRVKEIIGPDAAQKRRSEFTKVKIIQYDLNGNFIQCWNSASKAEKVLGISTGTITKCCKKERAFTGNCLWKYFEDDTPIIEFMLRYAKSPKCTEVDLIDEEGKVIETFSSGKEAEQKFGIARGKVSEICNHKYGRKSAKGKKFQWHYKLKRELVENGIK